MGFLDAYSIRARLFPAIIAAAPAIALAAVFLFWEAFQLQGAIAAVALSVLLFALSDLARRQGRRIEPRLIQDMGGSPSTTLLRFRDPSLDQGTKERTHAFLAAKLDAPVPTAEAETANPDVADVFYSREAAWLREHTRDKTTFRLLLEENTTYGFRRNLLGLKVPGLVLNGLVVLACLWFIWPPELSSSSTQKFLPVLVIAALHAVYLAAFVTRQSVYEASRTYARQLILSAETLRE